MVKVLIAYSTKSGNTEKLALAIGRGVERAGGVPVIKRAAEVSNTDMVEADGLIFGSPVYFGTPTAELKELIDRSVAVRRKLCDKVGAAFTTSGNVTGGKETTIMAILQAFLIHQMVVVGDPIAAGGHYGVASKGAPDTAEEGNGELLGEHVVKIAQKLTGRQDS